MIIYCIINRCVVMSLRVCVCVCVCVCVGVGVSIAEPLHRADFRRKLEGPDAALLLHILHSTWKHL